MKITKKTLLILLVNFYADNKAATPLLDSGQSDQGPLSPSREFDRLVSLLEANLSKKKASYSKRRATQRQGS